MRRHPLLIKANYSSKLKISLKAWSSKYEYIFACLCRQLPQFADSRITTLLRYEGSSKSFVPLQISFLLLTVHVWKIYHSKCIFALFLMIYYTWSYFNCKKNVIEAPRGRSGAHWTYPDRWSFIINGLHFSINCSLGLCLSITL